MLRPTMAALRSFTDLMPPPPDYHLANVSLDITDPQTAVFKAKLVGPAGSRVWARAWLGTEAEGTLAESASPEANAGDEVTLVVKLTRDLTPEAAYIRIESAPLETKHVMRLGLASAVD